ncbi:MAG: hypothetical protein IPF81_19005 [Bacteroidetes bacterium]|nr:hypothetical protein [Bacteroidota bacterium]
MADLHGILLAGGAPTINVGRTALAICNGDPNILYASVTDDVNNYTMHIYKTTDGGGTWDTCHIGLNIYGQQTTEFHWGQGWYNNAMTVHPQNCDLAFAGGDLSGEQRTDMILRSQLLICMSINTLSIGMRMRQFFILGVMVEFLH